VKKQAAALWGRMAIILLRLCDVSSLSLLHH